MILKNVKKNMVASGILGQIPEKKFGHSSSGYLPSEELECPLTKSVAGVDMADKNTIYPTKWELVKDNIYRRYVSKSQAQFKYRLRMEDGAGRIKDSERMYDDHHQPFTTQRAAEAHRNARITQLLAITPESLNIPNLHTMEELWADYKKNRGSKLRPGSLARHDCNARVHIIPKFKKRKIETITLGEVNNFICKLREEYEYSTVRSILATMTKIWKYAKELHIIPRETYFELFVDRDSKVEVPNKTEKEVKSFDSSEVDKCLEYAKTEDKAFYILLCLTYYAGVRVAEGLAIRWQDIDFENNEIRIRQQLCYDKTGERHTRNRTYIGPPKESNRDFYAAPQLMSILKEWKEEQEQNKKEYGRAYKDKEVLDNEITGGTVKGCDFVIRKKDGSIIPNYEAGHFRERLKKKVFDEAHYHGMRRTLVTTLVDQGVSIPVVSEFIGHADTRTTEEFYLNKKKLSNSKLVEVIGKI